MASSHPRARHPRRCDTPRVPSPPWEFATSNGDGRRPSGGPSMPAGRRRTPGGESTVDDASDGQDEATSGRRIREACGRLRGSTAIGPICTPSDVEVLVTADFALVAAEAEQQLLWLVGLAWQRGWQPSELARHARRRDPAAGASRGGADPRRRRLRDPSTVHPQWSAQVEAIADERATRRLAGRPRCRRIRRRCRAPGPGGRRLALLAALGTLPTILPPPGTDPSTWNRRDDAPPDDPVLAKVRALLAQAESTTFEARPRRSRRRRRS